MKTLLGFTLAMLAAACATPGENTQVAQAECKVVPMKPGYISGRSPRPAADPLDQRQAELGLASSDYRFAQLHRHGMMSNVETALQDCDRAATVR